MRYQIKQLTFDNGVSGLIVDIPNAASVYCLLNFSGGYDAVEDYRHKHQVAHVLEHVSHYTQGRTDSMLDAWCQNGAWANAFTDIRGINYEVECPRYDVARVLDLMAQMLERPDVTAEYLACEKKNIINELNARIGRDQYWLTHEAKAWLGHYSLQARDAIATLDNITLEDVQQYRERVFTTDNLRFIVAGDFSGDHTVADRLRVLGLPRGVRPERPILQAPDGTQSYTGGHKPTQLVALGLDFILRRPLSFYEAQVRDLARFWLFRGYSSRVFGEAQAKGWSTYIAGAGLDDNSEIAEPLYILTRCKPDYMVDIIRLIGHALVELSRGELPQAELARVKSSVIGRESMAYETAPDVVRAISKRYFASGEVVDLNAAPEIIRSITVSDIQQLVQEILADNSRLLGVFGDVTEAQVKDAVAALDAALKH